MELREIDLDGSEVKLWARQNIPGASLAVAALYKKILRESTTFYKTYKSIS